MEPNSQQPTAALAWSQQPDIRTIAQRLIAAALAAADPAAAVARSLLLDPTGQTLKVGDSSIALGAYKRIFVLGAGKAGAAMAVAAERVLGGLPGWAGGLVVVKEGHTTPRPETIELIEASHPLPDERGVTAAERIGDLADAATEEDLIIVLISGGGSALLADPARGLTLGALQAVTNALLRAGASITELNTVRRHLSALKGGRLAQRAAPATVVALVLSDVVGNPLDVIASGPTVPDPTTFADALAILRGRGLTHDLPAAVMQQLEAGAEGSIGETPKPGDPLFERVRVQVIADNRLAAEAALAEAAAMGLNGMLLTTFAEGEAREVGRLAGAIAREIRLSGNPLARPACVVMGGETTVTVTGGGMGGRNQELALAAALAIDGLGPDVAVVAFASDGGDGLGDAAGAIATGETVERARAANIDPLAYLRDNDSYNFWQLMGDAIRNGPTGTNVNDLQFIIVL